MDASSLGLTGKPEKIEQWPNKAKCLWRTTGEHRGPMDIAGSDRIRNSGARVAYATRHTSFIKPGDFNDPDMLEIDNGGMTADEYWLHMSLWSLLSAPPLAGNDLRTMIDETKGIPLNTDVIAVDHDGSVAVSMFNRGEQPLPISITWKSLGFAGKTIRARVSNSSCFTFRNALSQTLASTPSVPEFKSSRPT